MPIIISVVTCRIRLASTGGFLSYKNTKNNARCSELFVRWWILVWVNELRICVQSRAGSIMMSLYSHCPPGTSAQHASYMKQMCVQRTPIACRVPLNDSLSTHTRFFCKVSVTVQWHNRGKQHYKML